MKRNILTKKIIFTACVLSLLQLSCKKLVEVDAPVTSTNSSNVYQADGTAAAVLTGIYSNMSSTFLIDGTSLNSFMSSYAGLSADEFTLYPGASSGLLAYYHNDLSNIINPNTWTNAYPYIYIINSAVDGLNGSSGLTPAIKQQLLGEAKFLRAFYYFYLTNLYGDVPLLTGTDYKVNSLAARTAQATVYKQIIADLQDAQSSLSTNYLDGDIQTLSSDRIRPTPWAASAMLARVYLYLGDWADAESAASTVINDSATYSLSPLNAVFLANSSEAIWQLQPVNAGWNTEDARFFIMTSAGPNAAHPVYLSNSLLNSFEPTDQRAISGNWVQSLTVGANTYVYPYKYKVNTQGAPLSEYQMVLRLGELFLIRAEARAQQGNISGAQSDLNRIRSRAGLGNTLASSQSDLITAIQHERQVELFSEWGHRWLDLKRTKTVDAVMGVATVQKGWIWSTGQQLYPIRLTELQADPNLVQNTGY